MSQSTCQDSVPSPADDLEVLRYHIYEVARSGGPDEAEYQRVRERLMALPRAPAFLRVCPDYAKLRVRLLQVAQGSGSYAARDAWAGAQLAEFHETVQGASYQNVPATVHEAFADIDSEWVHEHWRNALEFLGKQDGHAVASARSMLESVCKVILHHCKVDVQPNWNVGQLVDRTRDALGLGGNGALAEMMDGVDAAMRAMAKIRASAGADHGLGPSEKGVHSSVAEFFVNTAGAIAVFLRRSADA